MGTYATIVKNTTGEAYTMNDSIVQNHCANFWSDSRILSIIENVADGVIVIDAKGHINLFNPAAERLFGYTAMEVIGENVNILIPPAEKDQHDDYIKRYLETGERHIIAKGREVEGQKRNGTTFPMYLSVGEMRSSQFTCFIGIVHDLSPQKAASQQIAKASQFMQTVIDSTPSILIGVNIQGTITHWNRAAVYEKGIQVTEAIGQSFVELFPSLGITIQDLVHVINNEEPLKRVGLPMIIHGEARYVDLIIFPLIRGFDTAVARIDDVTERVRMQGVVVHTEKMLSIAGLAAGTAHEINTPLSIIFQGCQNIRQRLAVDSENNQSAAKDLSLDLYQMQQYLEQRDVITLLNGIQDAAKRCTHIVSELLNYSRRNVSSFALVSVYELINAALNLVKHDLSLRGNINLLRIKIRRDSDETVELRCDKVAIEQVLFNLLRNAAQAVGSDPNQVSPEIHIKVSAQDTWVQIEVADNGPGMTKDIACRVFEPFFSTKPIGLGSGLGLSVAFFIITQQHKGKISLITLPNQGARFIIRLPQDGATS